MARRWRRLGLSPKERDYRGWPKLLLDRWMKSSQAPRKTVRASALPVPLSRQIARRLMIRKCKEAASAANRMMKRAKQRWATQHTWREYFTGGRPV